MKPRQLTRWLLSSDRARGQARPRPIAWPELTALTDTGRQRARASRVLVDGADMTAVLPNGRCVCGTVTQDRDAEPSEERHCQLCTNRASAISPLFGEQPTGGVHQFRNAKRPVAAVTYFLDLV
jgi:hypothetical protein